MNNQATDSNAQENQPKLNEQTFTYVKKSKPWYKSKTFWFNAAGTAVGMLANSLEAADSVAPILKPFIKAGAFSKVTVAISVGNIILRAFTHKPIKGGKGGVQEVQASHE